jgi:hypothetical protein
MSHNDVLSRRQALQSASTGFGWLALSGLLAEDARAESRPQWPAAHFSPRVRSVVFCFMDGGPSHVDTFDPKPMLKKHAGEKVGDLSTNALYVDRNRMWLPSPWEFRQRGQSGLWVSDLFPQIAGVVDEICVSAFDGRPPAAAWTTEPAAAHRSRDGPASESWGMGFLRVGNGEPQPARLRAAQQRLGAQRRDGELRQLVSAGQPSGNDGAGQRSFGGQHRSRGSR